jgi:hypothetical protein
MRTVLQKIGSPDKSLFLSSSLTASREKEYSEAGGAYGMQRSKYVSHLAPAIYTNLLLTSTTDRLPESTQERATDTRPARWPPILRIGNPELTRIHGIHSSEASCSSSQWQVQCR